MLLVTPEEANRPWVDESLLAETGAVVCLVQLVPDKPEALSVIEELCSSGVVTIESSTLVLLRLRRQVYPWRNGSHFRMTICFGDNEASRNLFRALVLPHLLSFKRNVRVR